MSTSAPLAWMRWATVAFVALFLDVGLLGVARWQGAGSEAQQSTLAWSDAEAAIDAAALGTARLASDRASRAELDFNAVESDAEEDDPLVDPLAWIAPALTAFGRSRVQDEIFRVHALIPAHSGWVRVGLPRGPPALETIG